MASYAESHAISAGASGPYQTLFELARGGMGKVFVARTLGAGGFERLVLIKRLHAHLAVSADAVRRFLDEGRVAAHVRHANVVGTLQMGSDDEGYFLVLEYIEGASLENLLDYSALRRRPLDPSVVLRIALDVCAGLQAIHDAQDPESRPLKILHRDVSLQNVLVGRDGVARIADFGIAKSAFASVSTDQSYVVGKLLYLPAEYLLREGTGPSLDVYSLGMTLWLTLSGREPWPGASEAQLVRHIVGSEAPPLSTVMTIAPRIEQVVARACRRQKDERYQSAREMAADIEAIARESGGVATHAEVAASLEALAGADLRRRRELIAKGLSRADRDQQPPRMLENSAETRSSVDEEAAPAGGVEAPRIRPRWVAVAIGVMVAAALVLWFWERSGTRVRGATASSATPAATTAKPPIVVASSAGSAATRTAPHATAVAVPPPSVSPQAAKARAATSKRPAARAPEPVRGPRAPGDISRRNPYRGK
jgi:eukaryotic-like serine/threonine-protein kinase